MVVYIHNINMKIIHKILYTYLIVQADISLKIEATKPI